MVNDTTTAFLKLSHLMLDRKIPFSEESILEIL
jgi:hypothetical protein